MKKLNHRNCFNRIHEEMGSLPDRRTRAARFPSCGLLLDRWDRTPRFRGGRLLLRSDCSNTHLRLRGTHEWRSFSF
jgi:hypothetical protein